MKEKDYQVHIHFHGTPSPELLAALEKMCDIAAKQADVLQKETREVLCDAPNHILPCRHYFAGFCQYNGHCSCKKTNN